MGPNVIVQRQSRHLLNMRNLVQETATPGTKSQERRTKDRRVARETARRHVRKSVYAEGTQHMASSSTPTRTHLPSTLKGGTQPQSTTQNRNSSTQEMSQESPAEQPENHCKSRNQLKIWPTNCSWKPAAGGDTFRGLPEHKLLPAHPQHYYLVPWQQPPQGSQHVELFDWMSAASLTKPLSIADQDRRTEQPADFRTLEGSAGSDPPREGRLSQISRGWYFNNKQP